MIYKKDYLYKLNKGDFEFIGIYIKKHIESPSNCFKYVYSNTPWHYDSFTWDTIEPNTIVIEIGHKNDFPELLI